LSILGVVRSDESVRQELEGWGREKRVEIGREIASGKFCGLQSKEEKEKDDI
jgi:hypothetical protein